MSYRTESECLSIARIHTKSYVDVFYLINIKKYDSIRLRIHLPHNNNERKEKKERKEKTRSDESDDIPTVVSALLTLVLRDWLGSDVMEFKRLN